MFYRSQAGIRAWPWKNNAAVWGDMGSPSAEMQCCETNHKSINMAKVLKTKVKGSVNLSQYDLSGTQRWVRDFRKTGQVTRKATAGFGDSKCGPWHWLSSKLFDFSGFWNREARDSPGCANAMGAPEICLSAKVSFCSAQYTLSRYLRITLVPVQPHKSVYLYPLQSGYVNKFLAGEQDSGFST